MRGSGDRWAPCRAWVWHFLMMVAGHSASVVGVKITHTLSLNKSKFFEQNFDASG